MASARREAAASAFRELRRAAPTTALLAAVALVVALAARSSAQRKEIERLRLRMRLPHAGLLVPSFRATTLEGDPVTIGEGPSGERQLLFVFDTRCPFCRATLPAWERIYREVRASHGAAAAVYGISLDPEEETRRYVADHGVGFPVLHFPSDRLRRLYRAEAVPLTLVVDHAGTVLYARLGQLADQASVDSVLDALERSEVMGVP